MVHCPTLGNGIDVASTALFTVIGGTAAGAGNVISGNSDNGVLIDGTGVPADTPLYLKADGNTNNSTSETNLDRTPGSATLVGGVTYGTGVTGEAFEFNDTAGQRVVVPNDAVNNLAATALTLSAWINLSSLPGATPFVIASRAYSATTENYGLYVNSSGELVFEWYSAGAFHTETSSGADLGSRLGVFQQVAVVTDGSTVTFYVNGAAVGSSAMPDPLDNSASGNLEIGGLSQGPNLFSGLIDEFSLTLEPLPAAVIARIFANAGQGTNLGGSGTQDTTVAGNDIGTNAGGTAAIANGVDGVEINGAFNNTIGGLTSTPGTGAGNVISGNTNDGIEITGSSTTGNLVAGNLIGTNAAGNTFLLTTGTGLLIAGGATGNTIGGTLAAAANEISGNDIGMEITGTGTDQNLVEGDLFGINAAGNLDVGNFLSDIQIDTGASSNTIGGTTAAARDVIDAGGDYGINIGGAATANNVIEGDYIGLKPDGSLGAGNAFGIIVDSAVLTEIGGTTPAQRNIISGNHLGGVWLHGGDTTLLEGNYIGTDPTGTVADGNGGFGVFAYYGGGGTMASIGGLTPTPGTGPGNVISGNAINVKAFEPDLQAFDGNIIGLNATGTAALGVSAEGVYVYGLGTKLTIGGTAPGAGNLISGNAGPGIELDGNNVGNPGPPEHVAIEGNWIGTNITGALAIGNTGDGVLISAANSNTIGGAEAGAGNVISGNTQDGVEITGSGTTGNVVAGNFIGTNAAGTAALANGTDGVEIDTSASGNTIGGLTSTPGTGAGNLISGNTGDGVEITGSGTSGNEVAGNLIGLNAAGATALGNVGDGVEIDTSASNNTIGGAASGAGNVISGNTGAGVEITGSSTTGNLVAGNLIGTDAAGTAATANGTYGVEIDTGASSNTIGGTASGSRNVLSGNLYANVFVVNASDETVQGNYVGTDVTGSVAISTNNDTGVYIGSSSDNLIGGTAPGAGNVISGNSADGLIITAYRSFDPATAVGNIVEGNLIGLNAAGSAAVPNGIQGIAVGASTNTQIGGTAPGAGNVIAGSQPGSPLPGNVTPAGYRGAGIAVIVPAPGLVIEDNRIGTNASGTAAVPNQGSGIYLQNSTATITGNQIAGNQYDGITVQGSDAAAGLIGVWTADGNTYDGANFDGTLSGGATYAPGIAGEAFSFNGTSGYFQDSSYFSPPSGRIIYPFGATMEAWIDTTAMSGTIMTDGGGVDTQRGMGLFLQGGHLVAIGSDGTAGQFNFELTSPQIVNDGQWHMVAVTWTGTTSSGGVTLYVDGVAVASGTALATIGSLSPFNSAPPRCCTSVATPT